MRRVRVIVVLGMGALGLGCGGEPATTEEPRGGETAETGEVTAETPETPPPSRVVEGYYTAAGAPDPLACTSDDECGYGGILAANGCCWSFRDMNAAVMSTAYRDWSMARRTRCDVTQCPSPPVPAEPPDCLFQVRCAGGRCVNDCE